MARPKGSKDKVPRKRNPAAHTEKTASQTGRVMALTNVEKACTCVKCGTVYTTRRKNFPKVSSITYKFNEGYSPICSRCVIGIYDEKVNLYGGNERKAIRRVCEMLDIYYSDMVFDMTEGYAMNSTSRCLDYIRKTNLKQVTGTTFDDTLAEEEKVVKEAPDEKTDVRLKKAIDIFGVGFDTSAYDFLLKSYNSYLEPYGKTVTTGLMKNARFLSMLEYRATEAIKEGSSSAAQLAATFNKALKESEFDVTQKTTDGDEDPFGVWIKDIEQYCPAEYIEQNHIYEDVDKMSYFDRFIVRPIRNLFGKGGYEKDSELSIDDTDLADTGGDSDAE